MLFHRRRFIRHDGDQIRVAAPQQPLPFESSAELLALCDAHELSICEVARRNEEAIHGSAAFDVGLDAIWDAMHVCVEAGLVVEGTLRGGLKVKRRAAAIRMRLEEYDRLPAHDRDTSTEWLHAFALAVNEENAAGGRVSPRPPTGRLPGRGRSCMCHGVRCALCRARRHTAPGRKCGRDRDGASPWTDLIPGRQPGTGTLHRTQRHRLVDGRIGGPAGAIRRWDPPGLPRHGDRNHAPNRTRHDGEV